MKKLLLFGTLIIGSNLSAQTPGGGVTDIDGNSYETVILGDLEWMAENLRVTRFNNGSSISNVTDFNTFYTLNSSAYGFYNNDVNTDPMYGLLYNHYAVVDANGLCPTGWRSPSMNDWHNLVLTLDPNANIVNGTLGTDLGAQLKSTDPNAWISSQWSDPNNSSGFGGVGGGIRAQGDYFIMEEGDYWSTDIVGTTTFGDPAAQFYKLVNSSDAFVSNPNGNVHYGFSVRCVKDAEATGQMEIKMDSEKKLVKMVDLVGRETEFKPNTPLIFIYSDGTRERVMKLEE